VRLFDQYRPLFQGPNSKTLVLTANQRMSRFVQTQYGLWRQSNGEHAWPSLNVFSLSVWVQRVWQGLQSSAADPAASKWLMTAEQERLMWLQTIAEREHGFDLLAHESIADLASQAWRFLRLWRKELTDLRLDALEYKLFASWVEDYRRLCEQKHFLDLTSQLQVVIDVLDAGNWPLPQRIVLVGFDEISPLEQHLFDCLRAQGVDVSTFDVAIDSQCQRVMLTDTETELRAMARWAATLVEEDSGCSIGLVIPDLANLRPQVTRILTQVFEPQAVFADRPRHAPGFNISAAQPLAQTPLMACALTALQLNQGRIEREQAQLLLASPFIGDEQELSARLTLLTRLSQRYLDIPVTALRAIASESLRPGDQPLCPLLHRRLHEFHAHTVGRRGQVRPCHEWADIFDRQLRSLGWPGSRALDTLEFQQYEHWPELLSQMAALDHLQPPVSFSQALNHLSRLMYVPFHAQTSDSPVQVLGLLEAAGQQFDYLWVMGMDSRAWPEPSKPNPLLPSDLQRHWQMPRASAQRELAIAQRLTNRLKTSAHRVIFSAPLVEGDQPLQPSPLIASIPEVSDAELSLAPVIDYKTQLIGHPLERFSDDWAPPVADVSRLRGGTQILKNQAACPFRAFAIHRLQAQDEEILKAGIPPPMRGNLIHQALDSLWRQWQAQSALLALTEAQLDEAIDTALSDAWRAISGQERLGSQLKAIEQQRAHGLLKAWLELEKQRSPFSVLVSEKAGTYSLGGIPLAIRYDRIDELDDGSLLVLDYKTGNADIKAWTGMRPDEPQVPLYTLAQGDRVQAAALVQINVQAVVAKGIAVNPDVLLGLSAPESLSRLDLPDDWSAIITHWRAALSTLADEFMAGDARVAPKTLSQTCRFCDLHGLCRIRSAVLIEEPDPEGDTSGAGAAHES
jgi:ATP-dependent helicase/nuclease subunit B